MAEVTESAVEKEKYGWNSLKLAHITRIFQLSSPQTLSPSRPTGAGIRHGAELKRQQKPQQEIRAKGHIPFLTPPRAQAQEKCSARLPVANSSSLEKPNNYSKIRIWHIQKLEIRDSDWIHCQAGWAPLS